MLLLVRAVVGASRGRARARARRRAGAAALALALLAALGGCGDEKPVAPTDTLPGIAPGQRDWSWRDVLAASLPGESAAAAEALSLPQARERVDALDALASAHDPRTVATAMAALRDGTIGVAAAAADTLGRLGARSAIPRLLNGIGPYPVDYDVPIAVRAAEASALAQLHNPAGVPLLLAVLAEGTSLQLDNTALPWVRTEQNAFMQELAVPGLRTLAGTDFGFHPMASVPQREEAVRQATAWWNAKKLELWAAARMAGLSRRRHGIARLRLAFASVATALFGASIFLAALFSVTRAPGAATSDSTTITRTLALLATVGYLAAYAGAALASGKITGAEGDKFTAGTLVHWDYHLRELEKDLRRRLRAPRRRRALARSATRRPAARSRSRSRSRSR